jgi:hypothetical protein
MLNKFSNNIADFLQKSQKSQKSRIAVKKDAFKNEPSEKVPSEKVEQNILGGIDFSSYISL